MVNQVPASTAATQCRVITRDMTGKNVWDYTLLHGSCSTETEDYHHNGTSLRLFNTLYVINRLFVGSFVGSFVRLFVCFFVRLFVRSFVHSLVCLPFPSFVYSFSPPPTSSLSPWLVLSFVFFF